MPIEFNCTGCQKRLRVPDASAGKKARCPDCGSIQDVPSGFANELAGPFEPAPASPATPFSDASESPFARPSKPSDNPYQAPEYSAAAPVAWDSGVTRAAALAKVQSPATALIVFSVLSLFFSSIQAVIAI